MSIENVIYQHLINHAGLAPLVGARVYPLMLPQDSPLPAIVYQRISTVPEITHGDTSPISRSRFQFSCWAGDYDAARDVAVQLRAALHGTGLTQVGPALLQNEIDDYEPTTRLVRIICDYSTWEGETYG